MIPRQISVEEGMRECLRIGMKNRILYGLIYAEEIPMSIMADKLGVHPAEISRWCCEGKLPEKEVRKKIADYFKLPEQIIFWESNI